MPPIKVIALKLSPEDWPPARLAAPPSLPNVAPGSRTTGRIGDAVIVTRGGKMKLNGTASGRAIFRSSGVKFATEVHRADVKTPTGIVLEFQHSNMTDAERLSREAFYGDMIWILDGWPFRSNFDIYHALPHQCPNRRRTSYGRKLSDT
jgi:hypothetical protein